MTIKIKKFFELFSLEKISLIKKINSLELEKSVLEETIKEELYITFINKLKEPQELNRIKKENKNLRIKVKTLKSLLNGDNNHE